MERLSRRWTWELRRLVQRFLFRFGPAGVLTVVLALVAGAGAWWGTMERAASREWLARGLSVGAPATSAPAAATPAENDQARLLAFDRHIADYDDIAVVLQDILVAAEKQGLVVERGDYRLINDESGRFARFRMNLPMTGDIGSLRAFLQTSLLHHRALALESVRVGREKIDAREVQAMVQWSILVRPKGVRAPPAAGSPPPSLARNGAAQ